MADTIIIKSSDLIHVIPLVLLVFLLRALILKWILHIVELYPKASFLKPDPNSKHPHLETAYAKSKTWNRRRLVELAELTGLPQDDVAEWLKRRRRDDDDLLKTFGENVCQYTYYTLMFSFGVAILSDKPWPWDARECWRDHRDRRIGKEFWWYYMIPQAYYYANLVIHATEPRRGRFAFVCVHHAVSAALLTLSWIYGFVRAGSVVMVIHDSASVFLEASKVAFTLKKDMAHALAFVVFTVVWMVTRMALFPLWALRNFVDGPREVMFQDAGGYAMAGLLAVLFGLHCFSTYMIFKIFYNAGKVSRSKEHL
ncbi:unnamed protein product [Phyllotreta striolata]|uniref:TLC domain-containing protein n=1 Tax=Phyllotreta striolata TaxID=444603 RepID=A0A9N9XU18_PHYSR|nr:unnamed protein product [Phyllotreta striolata]